jgi:hypothetical protein
LNKWQKKLYKELKKSEINDIIGVAFYKSNDLNYVEIGIEPLTNKNISKIENKINHIVNKYINKYDILIKFGIWNKNNFNNFIDEDEITIIKSKGE